jgi:hypothetical protein
MKTQIEIVQHLIDTLIEYIDKMVKRQQQLRKELTQNPTNTEFIVKKTEMDILQLQTEKLTELLKSTMTELMSLGNSNSDSCECETGKAVDRHHPNCKWMNEIFFLVMI